jgi:uncharacterized membrane protein YeaQ/YmgE (transglycosylase-associated protein family)
VVAISIGVAGAVAGGIVGTMLGAPPTDFDFRSLILAINGSLAVLFCYRAYAMRSMA